MLLTGSIEGCGRRARGVRSRAAKVRSRWSGTELIGNRKLR